MCAQLRMCVEPKLLTRVCPVRSTIKSPAIIIALLCAEHTLQGPQRHTSLLNREVELNCVAYQSAKQGGTRQFVTHVISLFADIEDPLGKGGDVDKRSDRSKKLRFLRSFVNSTYWGHAERMMSNEMKDFSQCARELAAMGDIRKGLSGKGSTVSHVMKK